jgi:hypothetical protein
VLPNQTVAVSRWLWTPRTSNTHWPLKAMMRKLQPRLQPLSYNCVQTPMIDPTPTSTKVARRLSKFTTEVQRKRKTLLIASPPKQKPPTKPVIPHRSRRITAQPLGHIPASKRGEVLLM